MSVMTHPTVRGLRAATRKIGLNRLLGAALGSRGYETRLGEAMTTAVQTGDCVWDVGANQGFYTARFSRIAGSAGKVLAFEPSAQNRLGLAAAVEGMDNVAVMPIGLSDQAGSAVMRQGEDDIGATSQVVTSASASDEQHFTIELNSGDQLIAEGKARAPNVMKIDVEGHEMEVLRGMAATLSSPELRDIFIEVHFELLAGRGTPDAPSKIEALLRKAGFTVKWIDPSHIRASRA